MLTLKWFVYIVYSITRFFVILTLLNSYPKTVKIFESDTHDMWKSLPHQEDETAFFGIPHVESEPKIKITLKYHIVA